MSTEEDAQPVLKATIQEGTSSLATGIFLQDACLQHRYIRSKDISNIVERPERLRAVTVGLAAAIARLEEVSPVTTKEKEIFAKGNNDGENDTIDLTAVMDRMTLNSDDSRSTKLPIKIIRSQASVDILKHAGVKFIHGDAFNGDIYLENLQMWTRASREKIAKGESEIPDGLSQGDLYLCPESLNAMQGAIGTVCEAVDVVISSSRGFPQSSAINSPISRAFVAIRPPGHHCGEDTPSGFCFLNNVAVGAAHAHLQHGINRIVILDIDLHHGNGTQSIVWQINEETYRQTLESENRAPESKPGPRIYYGSIHDILSFPCEDGKAELVQAASVSIHKSHGQYIENIHLQTYLSEEHFWSVLYKDSYSKLLQRAEEFVDDTGGPGDDVMVFISCGMDACEHEYESMSRHNRKVPTSFYYQFACDTRAFSDKYAAGRLVSVLEGGYSNRALMSGAMAHLTGLADAPAVDKSWWSVDNLTKLEKATKKRQGGRISLPTAGSVEPWIERTLEIFRPLDNPKLIPPRSTIPAPPSSRTLRDRGKSVTPSSSSTDFAKVASSKAKDHAAGKQPFSPHTPTPNPGSTEVSESHQITKKLPRVILKLGKPPDPVS